MIAIGESDFRPGLTEAFARRTSGKGDDELGVVAVHRVDLPDAAGDESFALELPTRPWTWHGKLVSLDWSIEVVALPDEDVFRIDLEVLPPTGDA